MIYVLCSDDYSYQIILTKDNHDSPVCQLRIAAALHVQHYPIDKRSTILGIPVNIENEGGVFTVTDREINMYGVGKTKEEAEEDYRSVVREYFEDLDANEDKLSEDLKTHLYYLRAKAEHNFH